MNIERSLASVQTISDKKPIKGADLIEAVKIKGWWVITKVNEFQIGDPCIYFEIDSFLPIEAAYEFLRSRCYQYSSSLGEGFKLKTLKLKGQLSQGLAIPYLGTEPVSTDLTKALNVQKWEVAPSIVLGSDRLGKFPSFIPRTDQERCQNLSYEIAEAFNNKEVFEITRKLDGSSITTYFNNGYVGVCSRNFELKADSKSDTAFIKCARISKLMSSLEALALNIAVQGELIGEGIQGNPEGIQGTSIAIYNIFDIDKQEYLNPRDRMDLVNKLIGLGYKGSHVPVVTTAPLSSGDVENLLTMADAIGGEGLVFKSTSRDFSFKAISNKYLLKES
jgi:RNA ligase (TIGR02306 family)